MMHPAIAARILAPVVADLLTQLNERMNTMLPLYMSHKIVEAMRIDQILVVPGSDIVELTSVMPHAVVPVKRDWVEQKVPGEDIAEKLSKLVGGYFMKYPDGYTSYSPAKAFKDGYTLLPAEGDAMYALNAMKQGKKVARHGWNGKGMWLELQVPDEHSKMTLPYIYLNYPANDANPKGARVPWVASQTDMLSNDWYVVE